MPTAHLDLDTPALCLDLDAFEANIRHMVQTCKHHGVHWRPHAKCHKSAWIAGKLVEAGAIGVTCATLAEAEVMARSGIEDVLIAHMLAGPRKIERLLQLTRGSCRPIVCVDHPEQARAIAAAMQAVGQSVRILIELEIGMERVGVAGAEAALVLAEQVDQLPGLELAGVMAYEGHLLTIEPWEQKQVAIREALQVAVDCRDLLHSRGLPCPIVSCGGTGSFPIAVSHPGITEIQAGGAIFMDAFYRERCHIEQLSQALSVVATVVSTPTAERAVIDAGRKALDTNVAQPRITSHPGVEIDWLAAEHGVLRLDSRQASLRLGDTVEILPGYADLTNHLHHRFYGLRQGQLERIIPIQH